MDRNLYSKTTVKVQKRSGFDKSHQNLFTASVGTLVPILVDELIPNTTVDLEAAISAQLPPLASDTFMRCKLKYASFFVPTRLLVAGYERWLTGSDRVAYTEDITADKRIQMPNIGFDLLLVALKLFHSLLLVLLLIILVLNLRSLHLMI